MEGEVGRVGEKRFFSLSIFIQNLLSKAKRQIKKEGLGKGSTVIGTIVGRTVDSFRAKYSYNVFYQGKPRLMYTTTMLEISVVFFFSLLSQ